MSLGGPLKVPSGLAWPGGSFSAMSSGADDERRPLDGDGWRSHPRARPAGERLGGAMVGQVWRWRHRGASCCAGPDLGFDGRDGTVKLEKSYCGPSATWPMSQGREVIKGPLAQDPRLPP